MSRRGECWDNAVVESFFGSLKSERVHWRSYQTREEARADIVDYITMFYNSRRLHSYLGYQSPDEFERNGLEGKDVDVLGGIETVLGKVSDKLMPEIVAQAEENAKKAHGSFEIVEDFEEGMRGADVVYAKAWGSMLTTSDLEESAKISAKYQDWIVDARRMEMADEDAIYMHPLPADRNIEVADEVIDGRWSRVFDQAENRLHAQKAVMALTM